MARLGNPADTESVREIKKLLGQQFGRLLQRRYYDVWRTQQGPLYSSPH